MYDYTTTSRCNEQTKGTYLETRSTYAYHGHKYVRVTVFYISTANCQ